MKLSLYIAKRYLFSKKTHNAINIISSIAICGVAVATIATVCTMSVFNGFQGLVSGMFGSFDPELKITPVKGKVFDPTDGKLPEIYMLPEIEHVSEVLEDNAFIRYRDRQVPAIVKGVSENFAESTHMQDILLDGEFKLQDEINKYAFLGIGLANNLNVNAGFIYPMDIYAIKRKSQVNLANPASSLNREYAYIGGVFRVNQAVYDENYLIVPIDLARQLFNYEKEVSALEIKLKTKTTIDRVQKNIREIVGNDYYVKNRYEQQEAAFKMINVEKWMTFLILCFILLIVAFNIIGSLSILMVDKQSDIITLRNLGADNRLISRIFLFEGWLISVVGAVAGIILGVLVCLGQQHFGWLQLGEQGTFAVNAYPVVVAFSDLALIMFSVLTIGFLSVLYPVRYLSKKWLN
ncbi:MAG: ABC transporter permease [Dysgonamonadaceae bacterium]|nr:ABC transporter permease [Dysgonamonadaceae bacterium]